MKKSNNYQSKIISRKGLRVVKTMDKMSVHYYYATSDENTEFYRESKTPISVLVNI